MFSLNINVTFKCFINISIFNAFLNTIDIILIKKSPFFFSKAGGRFSKMDIYKCPKSKRGLLDLKNFNEKVTLLDYGLIFKQEKIRL